MIGRVGGDSFGKELLSSLQNAGVQIEGVLVDGSSHSGVAMIAVDDRSENHIIVIPGANGQVDETDVERLAHQLPGTTALLLQFEIPLPIVYLAAQAAKKAGVRVILDPAPASSELAIALYPLVDIITPNAVEASQLVGFPVIDSDTAAQAANLFHERGLIPPSSNWVRRVPSAPQPKNPFSFLRFLFKQ